MKITLIRPNLGMALNSPVANEKKPFQDNGRMEPLELAVIAALTPPDVEIVMYDDRIEPVPFDEPTDLVAISVEIYAAKRAYEIAAEYRKRNIPVILGGVHVTLIPEEAALYADSIFTGDAEFLWETVIEDAKRKQLKPIYRSKAGCGHPGKLPRRDIFQNKKYLPLALAQFGRGCPYGCTYCAISAYFDKKHFTRKIDEVLKEVEEIGNRLIFFVDDNIVANPSAAKELFKALIPMKIKWVGQSSIEMTNDLELMSLMEKSGCLGHVVGFEAITEKALKVINKKPNLNQFRGFGDQIKIMQDYGQQIWAAMIMGHDQETVESINETLEFALKHKFAFAAFNIIVPYPNTPFYEQLKAENRLLYDGKWWLHNDYRFNHAAFIPKYMTPEQLTNECFAIKQKWNSMNSILTRVIGNMNMKTFTRFAFLLKYSLLFRQETLKKQNMKLGYK